MEGPVEGKSGVFYYEKDQIVTGYVFDERFLRKIIGGDKQSTEELKREINKIDFRPFNYEAEVRRVDQMLADQPDLQTSYFTLTVHGSKMEIRFIYEDIDYTLIRWNPKPHEYAPYSSKIAKLDAIIKIFEEYQKDK